MRQKCHERKELKGELDSHWPLKIKNLICFAHVETQRWDVQLSEAL